MIKIALKNRVIPPFFSGAPGPRTPAMIWLESLNLPSLAAPVRRDRAKDEFTVFARNTSLKIT